MTHRGPIELHVAPTALLECGGDVTLEAGVSIEAVDSIVVRVSSHLACGSPAHVAPLSLLSREPSSVPGRRIAR